MSIQSKELTGIQKIFQKQKDNRIKISTSSVSERRAKLKKLLEAIYESIPQIEKAIYEDFQKPSEEVRLTEIFPVTSEIKHAIRKLKKWTKPYKVSTPITFIGSSNKIFYEPIGQSLIISPWNFPFMLAVGPLVSAIAAGNCVILKPSEKSPQTSKLIREIISKLFDENEIAIVLGGIEESKELLKMPFNHIFFTGSPEVGKIVMNAASKNLSKVTLELGGKSPAIIDENADIKEAAERITWGKFFNAGQTCIAPDYLLIHQSRYNEFINHVEYSVEKYYGKAEELVGQNNYCRLINEDHYDKVNDLLDDAVNKGAKIIYGGKKERDKKFVSPTLITDVSVDSEIMKEEIFGPVLPVFKYENESDILAITDHNPNPLALYLFSKNNAFVKRFIKLIAAGGVAVNDVVVHFVNNNLPFGGINKSGIGKAHGFYGFKAFSNEKSIMKQRKISALKFLYPPYNDLKNKMINIVVRYF